MIVNNNNNNKKKMTNWFVDFAISADHSIKLKETKREINT